MKAEQLTDPVAYHAEGPVWSPRWGGLRWVDMLAGDILSLAADGAVGRRQVGSIAAACGPAGRRRGHRGRAGLRPRGGRRDADAAPRRVGPPRDADERGGCDPDGRFWCGSMAYDQTPGRRAVPARSRPSVRVVLEGVTISNGLEWSPDGSLAYYDDTATHRVDVFDYDRDAGLTGRRPFVRWTTTAPGRADRRRRAACGWP